MKACERKMHSKAGLKKGRGWTESLINRFLPEPCEIKPNPYYDSAPPMLLYSLDRVLTIESSEEFKAEKEKADRRKQAGTKAAATKVSKLVEEMKTVELHLPTLTKEELVAKLRPRYPRANFTNTFFVNYLRHCLTPYEDQLEKNTGKVGVDEAYAVLKNRILDAIQEQYPWLAEACQRQQRRLLELRKT